MRISERTQYINYFIFILAILCKGLGDAIFVKANPYGFFNLVKYIILLIGIFIYAYELKEKKERGYNPIFRKEFNVLVKMIIIIFIISCFYSVYNERFSFRTVKELIFITIPIVFAYCMINIFEFYQINICAKISATIFLLSYFWEIGIGKLNISMAWSMIKNISLLGGDNDFSKSVFESSYFADPVMALFCFFTYFRETKWMIVCYIGILLMNKRVLILFATIILLIRIIPQLKSLFEKRTNRLVKYCLIIVFIVLPFVVKVMTMPYVEIYIFNRFGINMQDFWMGRDVMVQNLQNAGFESYGLGSTFDFYGKLFEIESLKFVFELSVFGWIVIVLSYWKIIDNYLYLMIVMTYIFVNINTSTSIMTGAFSWIFYLLLIGCIKYKDNVKIKMCYL